MNIQQYNLSDDTEYIKIHGLQRTGTNYLKFLLRENLDGVEILSNAGGWKHGHYCAPWVLGREVHVITMIKTPYSWLVSLYNHWGPTKKYKVGPDLTGVTFEEFVTRPAVFEESSGAPFLYKARTPVDHWNSMNFHWHSIKLNQKKSIMIPYESLLLSPISTLTMVSDHLSLKMKDQLTLSCPKVLEPGEEDTRLSDDDWRKTEYYDKKEYLKWYTPKLLDQVNDMLDKPLMTELGFPIFKKELV